MLKERKEISYAIDNIVPFYDGAAIFGSTGLFYINRNDSMQYVENIRSIAAVEGDEGCFFISEDERVFLMRISFAETGAPFASLVDISTMQYDIEWGADVQMEYVLDTLYIATEKEVWGWRMAAPHPQDTGLV